MKSVNITEQLRQSAHINRKAEGILLPGERTYRTWPLCLTCFKEVDACELRNQNTVSVEIWASCSHGDTSPNAKRFEDFYKVTFPFRLDGDPFEDSEEGRRNNWAVKRAMHDFSPFDPTHKLDTSQRK